MNTTKLWIYQRLAGWLPESRCFGFKNALLRWAGAKIGENVRVYSSAKIFGTGTLEIGNDVHIGHGVFLSAVAPAGIKVGSCVDIGPQCMILTGSHQVGEGVSSREKGVSADDKVFHMAGKGTESPVEIGDGCWLGARSVILPGVNLPKQTVVAAGAVVTEAPKGEKTLVAGVPAVEKKQY